MDLLRIKSRSRSPTRAAAEHKRQSTTSPARSAFTGFGGDRGDRNSSGALALDEKQATINANAVDVVELSFPSLLNPPNPAFVSGSEARGILIKRVHDSACTVMREVLTTVLLIFLSPCSFHLTALLISLPLGCPLSSPPWGDDLHLQQRPTPDLT